MNTRHDLRHGGRVLFVTGTDTGVGKTLVSRGALRALVRAGHAVFPLKLIETGCATGPHGLHPADGLALARAAQRESQLELIAPLRFELPAAPSTAARRTGTALRFAALRPHVSRALAEAPRVLLEGAGGLLVPIGPDGTFGDFAASEEARALIVARDALGTLNHTLLTVEAARRRGIAVAGVVLNAVGPVAPALDHAADLRELLPQIAVYGPLPWIPDATDDEAAAALIASGLDAARLLRDGFGESPR